MGLKGLPNVLDIRPVGLTVGIDLASKPDGVGKRGFEALELAFYDHGLMLRAVRANRELEYCTLDAPRHRTTGDGKIPAGW